MIGMTSFSLVLPFPVIVILVLGTVLGFTLSHKCLFLNFPRARIMNRLKKKRFLARLTAITIIKVSTPTPDSEREREGEERLAYPSLFFNFLLG